MNRKVIYNQEFLDSYSTENSHFDVVSLKSVIENSYGESNVLDYKEKLIKEDKIAKMILAMANTGGGTIIFGINDKGEPVGLLEDQLIDTTDFEKKINAYLPQKLKYFIQPIAYKEDVLYGELSAKNFYVFHINRQYRNAPYIAKKESESVKTGQIYIRKNTSNETATNEDLEELFKFRLLEQYEDLSNINLDDHIKQLKILYDCIEKEKSNNIFPTLSVSWATRTKNSDYPEEEFDKFIANMIRKKKRKIEISLEVTNID